MERKNLFQKKQSEIDSLITRQNQLPEQVFNSEISGYLFFHFDEIFTGDFFERMKSFLKASNEEKLTLAVLKPDPENYFFRNFGKYPVVECSVKDTSDAYLAGIEETPNDSPADALVYNSDIVILYSENLKWAIYADRNFELGIIGFKEDSLKNVFISIFGSDFVLNVKEAITEVLSLVYSHQDDGVPQEIANQLANSYS
ncbi:MAG: hypothetical protein IPJ30_10215 [Acidobacteria bacterium]|nr:hypothetical protein [Acidobacteriota bacterium]